MKNKYELMDCVEHPITKKKLIVKDFEVIDDQYIYYFDDYQCFPENMLNNYYVSVVNSLLDVPDEVKNRENLDFLNEFLKKMEDDLK